MSAMLFFSSNNKPFQRLVVKVGNNFLSAEGMGHEKVVLIFSIMPRIIVALLYHIFCFGNPKSQAPICGLKR